MSIKVNFNGAAISKPGSYSSTEVSLAGGFPLSTSGIVALIGEATGGAPGTSDGVQTFTSADLAALTAKYISGPIVDAARLVTAPARDGRIPNGASLIRVYKTNASTAASRSFDNAAPASLFTFTSDNFGDSQNVISVKIDAGVVSPSARIITVQKGDQKEVLPENAYAAYLVVQYTGAGTAATLTIQGNSFATTVTGAPSDNLTINLVGKSIQDLVDMVDAHASYTATTTLKFASAKASQDLDPISTALDIKTTTKTLRAQQKELMDIVNGQSALVTVSRTTNVEGIVAASAKKFLTGGALGASTNSSFQTGFDALLASRSNTVVPLLSSDATDLAALGKTDSSSTFTVDAVNLQALTHCITASNTKNRSERNCYVSKTDTFAQVQSDAQDLAHERASFLFQNVDIIGADGNEKTEEPWAASVILAGMQSGMSVGTPATFKLANISGISHTDYNPKTQVELAIDAGLLPLERLDSGGFRVVVQNTTYGKDANFVYNRVHVLAAADKVAYDLRTQLESVFVGSKTATGTASSIKSFVATQMNQFLSAGLIVGDDNNKGLGYKDLLVNLTGNIATVEVTITPVQGVDFILNKITLADIKQSA